MKGIFNNIIVSYGYFIDCIRMWNNSLIKKRKNTDSCLIYKEYNIITIYSSVKYKNTVAVSYNIIAIIYWNDDIFCSYRRQNTC